MVAKVGHLRSSFGAVGLSQRGPAAGPNVGAGDRACRHPGQEDGLPLRPYQHQRQRAFKAAQRAWTDATLILAKGGQNTRGLGSE
ncbi:hypothetical protein B7486_64295 [cyanobacterium TDX16]|nr:hypothetical protein B7486_64295 [cyanobacterium TDX16]